MRSGSCEGAKFTRPASLAGVTRSTAPSWRRDRPRPVALASLACRACRASRPRPDWWSPPPRTRRANGAARSVPRLHEGAAALTQPGSTAAAGSSPPERRRPPDRHGGAAWPCARTSAEGALAAGADGVAGCAVVVAALAGCGAGIAGSGAGRAAICWTSTGLVGGGTGIDRGGARAEVSLVVRADPEQRRHHDRDDTGAGRDRPGRRASCATRPCAARSECPRRSNRFERGGGARARAGSPPAADRCPAGKR